MKKNMGTADRSIRIIIAAVIAVLYYTGTITGIPALVLIILAAVFVLTSFIGVCPLYSLFRINSCRVKEDL
jgi:type III secretory pathway component EscV